MKTRLADMAPDRPVLLIDLPGFAESERIDFGDEPEEVWADALKRVIDTEIGSENYWLAGHSFGAYLAGLLSIEEKKNIDG